jgi:lipoyl(octanoyl) transferase
MDLSPFSAIDPCGYPGLAVTQLRDLGCGLPLDEAASRLASLFLRNLDHA